MAKAAVVCASVAALLVALPAALAGERSADVPRVLRTGPAPSEPAEDDCETRMQKLDASTAEGEERLAEKNETIAFCARQYARDTTIERLVAECAKYEEQPVLKQQFLAECQLAAFNYANALRTLKSEYMK